MADKRQSTDHMQNGGDSGTKVTGLTPRPYAAGTARHDSGNGASGAGISGAPRENRNKPTGGGKSVRSGNG